MDWPQVVSTAITVGGLVAIAMSTEDPQTKAMVAGAIAGALQPLGASLVASVPRRLSRGRGREGWSPSNPAERFPSEMSGS